MCTCVTVTLSFSARSMRVCGHDYQACRYHRLYLNKDEEEHDELNACELVAKGTMMVNRNTDTSAVRICSKMPLFFFVEVNNAFF